MEGVGCNPRFMTSVMLQLLLPNNQGLVLFRYIYLDEIPFLKPSTTYINDIDVLEC